MGLHLPQELQPRAQPRLHAYGRGIVLVSVRVLLYESIGTLLILGEGDPCKTYNDCDGTNICGKHKVCVPLS